MLHFFRSCLLVAEITATRLVRSCEPSTGQPYCSSKGEYIFGELLWRDWYSGRYEQNGFACPCPQPAGQHKSDFWAARIHPRSGLCTHRDPSQDECRCLQYACEEGRRVGAPARKRQGRETRRGVSVTRSRFSNGRGLGPSTAEEETVSFLCVDLLWGQGLSPRNCALYL